MTLHCTLVCSNIIFMFLSKQSFWGYGHRNIWLWWCDTEAKCESARALAMCISLVLENIYFFQLKCQSVYKNILDKISANSATNISK
jgi:hypothetical protein